MISRTPKWAVGMRKLGPGAYLDADGLHFSTREMCEHFGVPVTEENQRIARETTMRAMREAGLDVEVQEMQEGV